jgi:ribosomal-protein-alanine N-acetyltransferase
MSAAFERGTAANASEFAALHKVCFADAWKADAFASLFGSPGVSGWLGNLDGAPQSILVVRVAADECEILTLGTMPDARRHGLARALLRHGASDAHDKGARTMFLEVAETNVAARALYGALGFAAAGRRKGYYRDEGGKPVDALTWRADLPLQA